MAGSRGARRDFQLDFDRRQVSFGIGRIGTAHAYWCSRHHSRTARTKNIQTDGISPMISSMRILIGIIAGCVSALTMMAPAGAQTQQKPNIVVIMGDDI